MGSTVRTLCSAGLLLALVACGRSEPVDQTDADMASGNVAVIDPPEPPPPTIPAEPVNATPAEAEAGFDWIGTWAAKPELCKGGLWRFGRDRITTDGETSCVVRGIENTAEEVNLHLACTVEGSSNDERWTLRPEPEGRLEVARDVGPNAVIPVELGRCA